MVDGEVRMVGAKDVWAVGDCTASQYAPTAQVASQQGAYLARVFKQMAKRDAVERDLEEAVKARDAAAAGSTASDASGSGTTTAAEDETIKKLEKQYLKASKVRPFQYSHQGSLAYIGSERAIADLPIFNGNIASGGVATYLFWRSVYLSTLFSIRNRVLVADDWVKTRLFGRDVSRTRD